MFSSKTLCTSRQPSSEKVDGEQVFEGLIGNLIIAVTCEFAWCVDNDMKKGFLKMKKMLSKGFCNFCEDIFPHFPIRTTLFLNFFGKCDEVELT